MPGLLAECKERRRFLAAAVAHDADDRTDTLSDYARAP